MKTSRDRIDLDKALAFIGAKWTGEPHITYDPNVKHQYKIRRASTHDGTLIFSMELMLKALQPLLTHQSYYKPMGAPPDGMIPIYTVGKIKWFSVYGKVKLPVGVYPGQKECVVIPVRCEYVPITWARLH